ncbi:hypothetical protein PoB_006556900 [Plakobranchus ocellatus]|uniref:Uncharacterized protein n=1 Tax=Plakobranchus ocellatus TaxID=259542 RepID=A0AAV4D4I2_9GAST|nr:hypothetical protein PoB_006556900 [Plakobranchus ocellatus]
MSSGRNTKDEQDDERRRNKKRIGKVLTAFLQAQPLTIFKLGGFQLLSPEGKMKVLDRPVATEQARTGYIFRDKSEITTSLPQASASIGFRNIFYWKIPSCWKTYYNDFYEKAKSIAPFLNMNSTQLCDRRTDREFPGFP